MSALFWIRDTAYESRRAQVWIDHDRGPRASVDQRITPMGASGWAYFVPYQPDINKALQELREAVFKKGTYYTRSAFTNAVDEEEVEQYLEQLARYYPPEFVQKHRDAIKQSRSQPQPPPKTIQELLEMNGDDGTHCVIDIQGISDSPEFGKAAPLSREQLLRLFGTEKPTRDMVEQKVEQIQSLRGRWEGTYLIVYEDCLPSEIFLTGFSGD